LTKKEKYQMFTKREKQSELDGEAVSMSLHNHHKYAESVLRAGELKDELATHKSKLATMRLGAVRSLGPDARMFVQKGGRPLPNIGQLELEAIAKKVIDRASVLDEVTKLRNSEQNSVYSRLHLQDSGDIEFITSLDNLRGAVEILGCAVALHDARVTQLRGEAVLQIARALKPRRERIARRIGNALTELKTALEAETTLANELARQDAGADLAQQMQPKLFSLHVLADPALVTWIRQANRLGLMAQPDSSEANSVHDATALVSGAGTVAMGTL
jgi:hypothetical protein